MCNICVYWKEDTTYFYLPAIIGYPDYRASKLRIVYHKPLGDSTFQLCKIANYNLQKSETNNFAYYVSTYFRRASRGDEGGTYYNRYEKIEIAISDSNFDDLVTTIDSSATEYIDSNRVQASELQNPLFFPAKYSYQVGTGKILGIAANTEPLSTGQFGEYPLSVFTSKGIWTMLQGSGDVLFSNILPVNGEVVKNKDQIVPLSVGVTYTTEKGLYLISGRNVKDLTEVSTGPVNAEIKANTDFLKKINNNQLVQLVNYLSNVSIEQYLTGARIGFDKG